MGGTVGILSSLSPLSSSSASASVSDAAAKESWLYIKKSNLIETIGKNIFTKLFEEDPKTFQMFKSFRDRMDWMDSKGFKSHSKIVMNVIGGAVAKVQTEENFQNTIHTMGTAHSLFGISPHHFDIMKAALIEQLQIHLQEKFTPGVRQAWIKAFDDVAVNMQNAMKEHSGRHVT
jgi:hemoglobin-like flavoprotein